MPKFRYRISQACRGPTIDVFRGDYAGVITRGTGPVDFHVHELILSPVERGGEWHRALSWAPILGDPDGWCRGVPVKEELYNKIGENLKRLYPQTEQADPKTWKMVAVWPSGMNRCGESSTANSGVNAFIERR